MNSRQLVIGSLVALLVILALAIAASLGAPFLTAPTSWGQPGSQPLPIPEVPVRFGVSPFERTETEEKTLPAAAPASLELENQMGNTVVAGAGIQEIQVRATKRGRGVTPEAAADDLKNLQVEIAQQQGKVVVAARRAASQSGSLSQSGSIDLEVTVPYETAVSLRAQLGNVRLSGIRAATTVTNAMGNVEILDVQGDVDVTANLGNLQISDARIAHSLRLVNRMGQIEFQGVLPTEGDGNITSNMGNVVVELPAGSLLRVDATANLGKIRSDFPGELSAQGPGGFFRASSGNGGFLLRIQNNMGNVELRKRP